MKNKLIWILALVFVLYSFNVIAIPLTTFRETLANGTSISRDPSTYPLVAGTIRGVLTAGFNNRSLFYNDTGSHSDYKITPHHVNMSIAGTSEFLSGVNATPIQIGHCIDISIRRSADTGNANWLTGVDSDAVFNNGNDNYAQIGEIGGVEANKYIFSTDIDVWQATNHFIPYGKYENITINFSSPTAIRVYFNNSDD